MNYVLYHKIPYYIGISSEVLSMYIVWVFIDCLLWSNLISLYKPDVSYFCIEFIKLLLFVFYCQDALCIVPSFILMTSSISTLVDLWNTELMN